MAVSKKNKRSWRNYSIGCTAEVVIFFSATQIHRKPALSIQLVNFESDDYHSAIAKAIQEAQKLVEAEFEYVCEFETVKLFRKRK